MAEAYTTKWFLLHAKQEFLHEFFRRHKLLLDVPFAGLEEGENDTVFAAINAMEPDHREASEACFQDIYQMANRAGIDAIIAASRSKQLRCAADEDLVQRLGGMASHLDVAFWTFLYRTQYWEFACLCLCQFVGRLLLLLIDLLKFVHQLCFHALVVRDSLRLLLLDAVSCKDLIDSSIRFSHYFALPFSQCEK